jgi:hypothetical protein
MLSVELNYQGKIFIKETTQGKFQTVLSLGSIVKVVFPPCILENVIHGPEGGGGAKDRLMGTLAVKRGPSLDLETQHLAIFSERE